MMLRLGRGLAPLQQLKNTDPSLKANIASCVFDLDATLAASYPGSGQTWSNIVPVPADGSAKSAYNFPLGASTSSGADDPTFTGSAGSAAAYFVLDGGDLFRLGANTALIKAMHKTTGGSAWWVAMAFNPASVTNQSLITTNTSTTTLGARVSISSANVIQFGQRGDSATVVSNSAVTLSTSTNYLVIVSYDPVSGKRRFWVNTRTKSEASFAFNATSTDPSGPMTVAASASGSSGMASGTRIYAVSMGNAFIDDADAVKIVNTYNSRHGRTYA